MKIQVLGSGCDKCKKLAANAQEAAAKLGLDCEIEKITDINKITEFGVMMTPALVVDGKVVSVGKVLSPDEIGAFLKPAPCCCGGTCDKVPEKQEEKIDPCSCGGLPEPETSCCSGVDPQPCCCNGNKKIITTVLLFFVIASLAFMIIKEIKAKNAPAVAKNAPALQVPVKKDALIVYYLHGTQRCVTCNKIEELARKTIEEKYAKELANGSVAFKSVNVEEPANEHFIKDFQLSIRSVVMQKGTKYEKFDDVWTLVREPEKFASYLQDGAVRMLEAK